MQFFCVDDLCTNLHKQFQLKRMALKHWHKGTVESFSGWRACLDPFALVVLNVLHFQFESMWKEARKAFSVHTRAFMQIWYLERHKIWLPKSLFWNNAVSALSPVLCCASAAFVVFLK